MSNVVTGLFDSTASAENAVHRLELIGYGENELTIVMKDYGSAESLAAETGAHAMEGVGTGASLGGAIGAILAGMLAVGTVTLPGVGLLAAGPLAAMLAGAGAGGIAGGIVGWFVEAGIPEDVAPYFQRGLNDGGVVVVVGAHPGDEARVRDILRAEAVAIGGENGGLDMRPDRTFETASPETSNDIPLAEKAAGIETTNTPRTVKTDAPPTSEHDTESRHDNSQSGQISQPIELWENEGGHADSDAPPVPVDVEDAERLGPQRK